jgi:co-chaperonin GroES (HSP10)|uniref:Co-chaperonin GroES n=1 Tax=uncultured virus TaxID=340016 RepID=A0A221S4F9_9VIRU|nr:co-chaperonin GroES [uncultured virus]
MAEMTALQQKWAEQTAREEEEMRNQLDPKNMDESVMSRIPNPTGWRLVVLPFKPPKTTKSGLILAEKAVEKQQVATVCGYVVEVGPLAYADTEKFPHGAWCKKGDWVVFARYAGARINIEGGEIRILNDDEVLATIKDPEDIIHMV